MAGVVLDRTHRNWNISGGVGRVVLGYWSNAKQVIEKERLPDALFISPARAGIMERDMWSSISDWFKKFWGIVLAFVALVAFTANAAAVIEFGEEHFATPTPLPTPLSTDTPIPTVSPTPTLGPFQFLALPAQVRAGDDAEVILQARQGDVCTLEYFTPDGSKSSANGLGMVTADSLARCIWKWHISANTNPGMAKLVIAIQDIQETREIEVLPVD